MLHVKLFFYHPALLCHSILLEKNYATLVHSFGRGLILYLYIDICLSRISSIIPHVSPIPNFRKCHSTTHSFLEGVISLYFLIPSFITFHRAINPCFWEGWILHVISSFLSCIALSFHAARKNLIRPFISFLKGLVSLYFSIVSSIIVHCSIIPCFWEGVDVAYQTFLLLYWGVDIAPSYIALSLSYFLESNYSSLIYSFVWEGIGIASSIEMCVHIYSYPSCFMSVPSHTLRKSYSTIRSLLKRLNPLCLVERLLYHPSLLYYSIL